MACHGSSAGHHPRRRPVVVRCAVGFARETQAAQPEYHAANTSDRRQSNCRQNDRRRSPAFHGTEPHLALTYHSNDGNGFAGMGWSIAGLRQIQHASPGHGAPTYTSSDVYLLDDMPRHAAQRRSRRDAARTYPASSRTIRRY
jgi:hypothetical protein